MVDKQARVVEEVGIRKDVETRTETVRDTVRETEGRGRGRPHRPRHRGTERVATDRDLKGR